MYDAYLFDLDGTIYLGDRPLPGAAETLTRLRAATRQKLTYSGLAPTLVLEQIDDLLTQPSE